jgi:hypothetical protein
MTKHSTGSNRTNWLMLGITCLVLFGLAEALLHLKPLRSDAEILAQSVPYLPSAYSMSRLDTTDRMVYHADGRLRFQIKNGYRNGSFIPEKPDGEIRIVILGGSGVFDPSATGVNQDWPAQTERVLHERGWTNTRVINAGVPGHRTIDSVGRLLAEIHFYEPDFVLLCHAWNDIKYFNEVDARHTLLRNTPTLSESTHRELSAFTRLIQHSQVVLRVKALWHRFTTEGEVGAEGRIVDGTVMDSVSTVGLQQYRQAVMAFVDIARNMGAVPLLVTQPRLVTRDNTDEEKSRIYYRYVNLTHEALCLAFESCDRVLHEVAEKKQVKLLDLSGSFTGDADLFEDHVHFKDESVSARVGSEMATFLESILQGQSE